MILTKITDSEQLSQIVLEILLNTTDKITKVSDASVIKGYANGIGKLGNKALKDLAVIESRLFPDTAYGTYLDEIALRQGNVPRLGASSSSTDIRLVGDPGTIYLSGTNIFISDSGINFILSEDVTIPPFGFTYARVTSQTTGSKTNVDPNTITNVSPIPAGHQYVINEYIAIGGRDIESDTLFRERIMKGINDLANGTTSTIEQALIKINPRVLRARHGGIDGLGNTQIVVTTVDGGDLTSLEITNIENQLQKLFKFTEFRPRTKNGYFGISIVNTTWLPVDISFRASFLDGFVIDDVRKNIQINLNKYFDYRYWTKTKVEWDDILQIVKNTRGVSYVPDEYMIPNLDITIPFDTLPRVRGFIMSDLSGNIITNLSGTLNPVFYPNTPNFMFQTSVLGWIN